MELPRRLIDMVTTKDTSLNKINSVNGYLRLIFDQNKLMNDNDNYNYNYNYKSIDDDEKEGFAVTCYRGQSKSDWLLQPSISR